MSCRLDRIDPEPFLEELKALGLNDGPVPDGFTTFFHRADDKTMIVTYSIERRDMAQAHMHHFGVLRWRHITVSIMGALDIRLADQKAIGRKRAGGERSPAPLPDWYDLTHIAYVHWETFGFNPLSPVFQLLPPPDSDYLNVAEALHLIQPA